MTRSSGSCARAARAWRGGRASATYLPPAINPPYRSRMDRRRFLLTTLAGALAASLVAEAQQTAKMSRIGYLSPLSPAADARAAKGFARGWRSSAIAKARTSPSNTGGRRDASIARTGWRPSSSVSKST